MFLMRIIKMVLSVLMLTQANFAHSLDFWLTTSDQTVLFQKQKNLTFDKQNTNENKAETIKINPNQSFQTIDGFGYTLTGGSAFAINQLDKVSKKKLLQELFGNKKNSISISYLRISVGASDLNFAPFTYNDLPEGETDLNLDKFSLSMDEKLLIPLLQEILQINPKLKIMGSPWSAPLWMKDKFSFFGGHLRPEFYEVYSRYLVKYIVEMEKRGIKIDALTPQNEPLHGGNNPSMLMTPKEQIEFVKVLGKTFKTSNIKTKIVIYDHNCDKPEYPIEVLNNKEAESYIDGSAFHLYGGDISCMSQVKEAHPTKNLYFTEQYTSSKGNFADDLNWHLKNLIIGATRNWSKTVLEWNLANDGDFKPHTAGGCNICKGALTVANKTVTRNVSYYIIAHASKFVPSGSVRIGSNMFGEIHNVAFRTPHGKIVLIVLNDGKTTASFKIDYKNKQAIVTLPAKAVGTFVWREK